MKTTAWAVIRCSVGGFSYIDCESIACLPELAIKRAEEIDKQFGPQWAQNNVISQVIEVTILRKKGGNKYAKFPA
jgi:hypothetical protein